MTSTNILDLDTSFDAQWRREQEHYELNCELNREVRRSQTWTPSDCPIHFTQLPDSILPWERRVFEAALVVVIIAVSILTVYPLGWAFATLRADREVEDLKYLDDSRYSGPYWSAEDIAKLVAAFLAGAGIAVGFMLLVLGA